jgi:hypothetical protein
MEKLGFNQTSTPLVPPPPKREQQERKTFRDVLVEGGKKKSSLKRKSEIVPEDTPMPKKPKVTLEISGTSRIRYPTAPKEQQEVTPSWMPIIESKVDYTDKKGNKKVKTIHSGGILGFLEVNAKRWAKTKSHTKFSNRYGSEDNFRDIIFFTFNFIVKRNINAAVAALRFIEDTAQITCGNLDNGLKVFIITTKVVIPENERESLVTPFDKMLFEQIVKLHTYWYGVYQKNQIDSLPSNPKGKKEDGTDPMDHS